ncbi:MarR family transcriptional regulator [Peribacillus asahii]|nr:MarR family transcriptional regulator [Peribacillus asahii]USK87255.1 MarR family transcriptional regulator [Peribacillus asahii]
MKEDLLETIELEMAILGRRLTSVTPNKAQTNLDRATYLLLLKLFVQGSIGVKVLANELQLDMSTVSRQAATLEHKGYVNKIPDPLDGRASFYQITELGKTELLTYKQMRMERIGELVKEWSDEECEVFGRLLKKFNQALHQK